jgi:hypothetical protein
VKLPSLKTVLIIVGVLIFVIVAAGIIVWATTPINIENNGSVVATAPDVTADKTLLNWGSFVRGQSKSMTVTLVNDGETQQLVTVTCPTFSWGTMIVDKPNPTVIKGTPVVLTFTLTVANDAPFSDYPDFGDIIIA